MPNAESKMKSENKKSDTDADKAASDDQDAAGKAAREASEATDQSYEELRAQVETLKQDLVGLAEAAGSAGAQTARQAYGGAQRAGRRATAAAEDGYERAGERLDDAFSEAEDFVRERPAVAVGLAAGAGFLLAMCLSRR